MKLTPKKRMPCYSIADLAANNKLPKLSDDGVLDLSDLQIDDLEGLQAVPRQQEILKLFFNCNHLRTLSPSLFPHLTVIDVSNNPLEELPPDMLRTLVLLKKFYARNAALRAIPAYFFDGLPRLSHINLSNNQLTTLHPDLFKPVHALKKLNLSRNKITHFDPQALCLQTKLKTLYLKANRLRTIPASLCASLPSLRTLDLEDNEIDGFAPETFDGQGELRRLYLAGNNITNIDPTLLQHCTTLFELDLGRNQLSTVSEALIQSHSLLRALNLRGNRGLKQNLSPSIVQLIKERSLFTGYQKILGDELQPETAITLYHELRAQDRLDEIYYEHPDHEGLFVINLNNRNLVNIDNLGDLAPDPQLIVAILAQNNYLEEMPCSTLNKFTNLAILDLRNNRIQSLVQPDECAVDGAPKATSRPLYLLNLSRLCLSNNRIRTVTRDSLSRLLSLRILDLAYNELESIENESFNQLGNLSKCLLGHNNLTAFPAHLGTSDTSDLVGIECIDLCCNKLGSLNAYSFAADPAVQFYPQEVQPLQMQAIRSLLSFMAPKNRSEQLEIMLTLPKTIHPLIALCASRDVMQLVMLSTKINDCRAAFELPLSDATCKTWNDAFRSLQQEKWDEGVVLFFDRFAQHPLHKKLLEDWCARKIKLLEEASLASLAFELMMEPQLLIDLCMNAAPESLQRRMARAQIVHNQQLNLTRHWFQHSHDLLIANMKRDPAEESPQKRVELIEKTWSDVINEFRETFNKWSSEVQKAFFQLCPVKLRMELRKHGISPDSQ